MSMSVSPSQFKPTKQGYKKYLKALGVNNYDGVNTPFGVVNFEEFKYQAKDKIKELEERLEILNSNLIYLTYDLGQDETSSGCDAYHLNINIKNIVHELDRLYKQK